MRLLRLERWIARGTLLSVATLAVGCPQSTTPDVQDGPVFEVIVDETPDASLPSDRDMDGLCDDTELSLRTNPDDPDSDHDGLTDGFEVDMYTSPLSATDPPPAERIALHEIAGDTATLPFSMAYRGTGETLVGFALDRGFWYDQRGVAELGMSVMPIAVSPRGAVGDLVGPTVTSVNGFVVVQWLASLSWPSIAPQGCRRAYAGYASVYAQDRGLVWIQPVFVDVLADPNAAQFDAGGLAVDGGDAGPIGPWPYVVQGFCAPPPGYCR